MSSNGYPSRRTGQQTEALLDVVENKCVTVANNGVVFNDYPGRVIVVYSGTDTIDRKVVVSERITETNAVIAGTTFSGAPNRVLVSTSGSNEIKASTHAINDTKIIIAANDVNASDSGKMIVGSGSYNSVKPSSRVTDTNAVICSDSMVTNNSIILGSGNANQVQDTCGIASAEVELFADSQQHPKVINRNINLGTINYSMTRSVGAVGTESGSGTLAPVNLSNITNAISAKNPKLLGSILNFTFSLTRTISETAVVTSNTESAEVITVYQAANNNTTIGAMFNTFAGSGIQTYMLTIDTSSGAYTVTSISDTTVNDMYVQ